jgi:hypothetical protein
MKKMKMPKGVNKRWWGESYVHVPRGVMVSINVFWDSTEVTWRRPRPDETYVACFKTEKHAREFCRLNGLVVAD